MALRVLIADPLSEEGIQILRDGGVEVLVEVGLSPGALRERLVDVDGLIVRSATRVTADVLASTQRLKVIGRAGVGVDNIDVEAATRKGIVVINAPEGNTVATAEHAIAMMAALARHIPQAHMALVRDRVWDRKRFTGVQLAEKTLGIIGLGRVGGEVARRAVGLGMQVLGYDPYISEERARMLKVTLADVDEICRKADFITVHTPLTKATENLIGPKQFALMKPTVRLINCARGGIIDEQALLQALEEGRVAGAALDVFTQEPALDNPLVGRPDVIVTPHLGASTEEAQINVAVDVAREVLAALKGELVYNAVNAPALPREKMERMRPFLDLCERLGRLYTELLGGGQGRVEIVYSGEVAEFDCAPLTNAVLKGMLDPILEGVNYVNAGIIARDRQLQVSEVKEGHARENFRSLVTLRYREGDRIQRMIAGTVTAEGVPALVFIDEYRVNVDTPGHLLMAYNIDRPGVIGRVGTLLGENRVNIASMQVGRKSVGGQAVMILGVDNPIPDEVLEQLRQMGDLWDVHQVHW